MGEKMATGEMKANSRQREQWEAALEEFLRPWRRKREVIGALVTGSRVQGTNTPNSDIDVHIILKSGITWRERGNCRVAGFLVEYFCNPVEQYEEYRKKDVAAFTRCDARMFARGRIIFDTDGTLGRIQRSSRRELRKSFRKLSKAEIETGKYFLWDGLDDLRELSAKKTRFYAHAHHLLLNRALETYRRYLGAEVSPPAKLERYFRDPIFRANYGIKEFGDKQFVRLFQASVQQQSFSSISKLLQHVFRRMGGFEIDGWRFRSATSVLPVKSKPRRPQKRGGRR